MPLPDIIRRFFFPSHCCCCDTVLPLGTDNICEDCRRVSLVPVSGDRSRCEVCFLPAGECICTNNLYYDGIAFLFYNESAAKNTVYRFKFRGRKDLARCYAALLAEKITAAGSWENIGAVTAIPMSERAQRKRGYNQAQLLGKELSSSLGVPYEKILYKYYESETQHELDRLSRTGNILGAFEPCDEYKTALEGRNILVVDDIITGGSTLNEAAKTLKIFGADKVYCATAVATPKQDK